MRKVLWIPLLLGIVAMLANSMSPLWAEPRQNDDPEAGPVSPASAPVHEHRLAKHARANDSKAERKKDNNKFAAVMPDARGPIPGGGAPMAGGAAQAAQPQFALPLPLSLRPPMPPMPPPAIDDQNKIIAQQRSDAEKPAQHAAAAPPPAAPKPRVIPLPREVQQFCANTANAAADARVAWEAAKLAELEAKLKQRIAEFEIKRAEYEDWLHKHDDAMKQAKEDVVAIYSRMRPDAAAAQLAAMDDIMAASVLAKLNSRNASAILAEMDPGRAARIANAMVGPPIAASGKKS